MTADVMVLVLVGAVTVFALAVSLMLGKGGGDR